MKVLFIDPGTLESAYVIYDGEKVLEKEKIDNDKMLEVIRKNYQIPMGIERMWGYGQQAGMEVFQTCWWAGRLYQALNPTRPDIETPKRSMERIKRKDIKMHLCGTTVKINDTAIIQALVDRFTPYEKNKGKGTKKNPGFFYGFHKDIWQAFAGAVYMHDRLNSA